MNTPAIPSQNRPYASHQWPANIHIRLVDRSAASPSLRRCESTLSDGMMADMSEPSQPDATHRNFLPLSDDALLKQCDVDTYKSSGPGGQHRNKVSSAVRLRHAPSGLIATGDQSRSQHENKRLALKRLRKQIATTLRAPVDLADAPAPPLSECIHKDKRRPKGPLRLDVGRKDHRYWPVVAALLDRLEAAEGRAGDASDSIGISTSNLIRILKSDTTALTAAQNIRKRHGQKTFT